MKLRVGIDVGGTFTDVTAFDEDQGELVAVRKYVSNPAQPAAVMETITADLARDFGADAVTLILHGSTAALNTLLEGRGVRTGLLTTRGFRDVYEIGRQWRGEEVFNFFAPAPKMLLTRDRIHGVRERLDAAPTERGSGAEQSGAPQAFDDHTARRRPQAQCVWLRDNADECPEECGRRDRRRVYSDGCEAERRCRSRRR